MSKAPCARGGGGSRVAPCPPCKRNDTLLPLTLRGIRPSECRPCDVSGRGASRCSSTNVAIELDRAVRKSIGPAGGAAGPPRRAQEPHAGQGNPPRQWTGKKRPARAVVGVVGPTPPVFIFRSCAKRRKLRCTQWLFVLRPYQPSAGPRLPARCPSVRDGWRRRCAPCTRRSSRTTADRFKGADCHPCQTSGHQAVTCVCAQ